VPIEGANAGVFTDQNTSNTFQVPPGASTVEYKVYGGVGGDVVEESTRVGFGGNGGYVEGSFPVNGETTLNVYVGQDGANGVLPGDVLGGGRGGCVPFNGVKCGGDGGNGHFVDAVEFGQVAKTGGGGGGAPSIITNSENQIMIAAGGGAGASMDSGGGGGAGGGEGAQQSKPGEDADGPIKNLGGDANQPLDGNAEAGDTFIRSSLPAADSTSTSSEGPKVVLSASP
jgi:hypothetical protein